MFGWNSLKKAGLVSVVCLSGVVAHDVSAAPRSRKSSSLESFVQKGKTAEAQTPARKMTQPSPSDSIRNNIEKQQYYLDDTEKAVLIDMFNDYVKTPSGNRLMTELSRLRLTITSQSSAEDWFPLGLSGYNDRGFDIPKPVLRAAVSASSAKDKTMTKLKLSEHFTHAASNYMTESLYATTASVYQKNLNFRMNRYLQPMILTLDVQDQMLDAAGIRPDMTELEKKMPKLAFYRKLKEAKMADGTAASESAWFARSAVAEAYWSAKTTPINVNGKSIAPDAEDIEKYSKASFIRSFINSPDMRLKRDEKTRREDYILTGDLNAPDINIDPLLDQTLKPLNLSMPLSWLKENDPVKRSPQMMTLSIDGEKRCSFDIFPSGILRQSFDKDGHIEQIGYNPFTKSFEKPGPEQGKVFYPETEQLKFLYAIDDKGHIEGFLDMYAPNGAKIAELPISHKTGRIVGRGYLFIDGKKVEKHFLNGVFRDPKTPTPQTVQEKEAPLEPGMMWINGKRVEQNTNNPPPTRTPIPLKRDGGRN